MGELKLSTEFFRYFCLKKGGYNAKKESTAHGEIFKASYYKQYQELISLCKELGGRVAICRNHAKVMVLLGERFSAVVESSANVNTNPRIENTIITVDSALADWYKEFFDGIVSFERNFDDVLSFQP